MKIEKVLIYHLGARDKYLVAKYFHKKGLLWRVYTDYWLKGSKILSGKLEKKLQRRFDKDLNPQKITSFNLFRLLLFLFKQKKAKSKFERWISNSEIFTSFVNKKLSKLEINQPTLFWGYTGANLEVLKRFKNYNNCVLVHNQIDPGIRYYEIEQTLWGENPDYEGKPIEIDEGFRVRIIQEWELADYIVVNSNYSKDSLIEYGVSPNKIIVLPLIYERTSTRHLKRFSDKLNIAFVGNINLIKGFKLFIETAKELNSEMNFYAVGTNHLNDSVIANTKGFINFTGHLDKQKMEEMYKRIDILLFPTYCDGFGMVQLEAMANGIPVLATRNCGDVVIDGVNGYYIENSKDLINKLEMLNNDRNQLSIISQNAFSRVEDFSYEQFEQNLVREFSRIGINLG